MEKQQEKELRENVRYKALQIAILLSHDEEGLTQTSINGANLGGLTLLGAVEKLSKELEDSVLSLEKGTPISKGGVDCPEHGDRIGFRMRGEACIAPQ